MRLERLPIFIDLYVEDTQLHRDAPRKITCPRPR